MSSHSSSSGNAFIYILLAVALLGGLSFVLSKGNENNPGSELADASAKATAAQILSYASQAGMAVDQMVSNGTTIDNIDFKMPSNSNFNTAPTINKLFHPDGGGLQYKPLPKSAYTTELLSPANGYYVGRFNNFEWTPTVSQDVIFAAYGLSLAVCQQLQLKISGTTTIPGTASGVPKSYFIDTAVTGTANANLTATICAACDGMVASCVRNGAITSSSTVYTFYSILAGR